MLFINNAVKITPVDCKTDMLEREAILLQVIGELIKNVFKTESK